MLRSALFVLLFAATPAAFAVSRSVLARSVLAPRGLLLSQHHTCSLSLRTSGDEDAPSTTASPKTRGPGAVCHRRQGRVLGRWLYTRLEEELQETSDFGKDLAEKVFDSSVNVVDVSLAKFAKNAAMAADLSFLHSPFITGKGHQAAQAAWQAAEQVLIPLKSSIVHLGGVHPVAVAVGSTFAPVNSESFTCAWLAVLYHLPK